MQVRFIPQMNPMNWLALLVFVNGVLISAMAKIHFSLKANKPALESSVCSSNAVLFKSNI